MEHFVRRRSAVRTSSRSTRIAIAACLVAAPVLAQSNGDPIAALRAMEIRGESVFTRDRIAMTLVGDAATWRALRDGLDNDSAILVAERVAELHRSAGYAHAQAVGSVVHGVLHVALDAGPRFRCGEIRCSGNTAVTTATLRDLLAQREQPPACSPEEVRRAVNGLAMRAWIDGEFPLMDDDAVKRAATIVRKAYRAIGRHGVRADVTFEPDGERMAMVLSVADEGSEVRIKSLRLVGEDDAKAATVLAGLPFAPDTLATSATLAGLQRDLEATGRYLTVKVEIPNDAPAVLDPLAIAVEPSPGVLPEASQRDVDQARKALDAQIARLRRGDTLQVDFALAEAQQCGEYLRLGPGTVSIRLSRDGYALEATNLQWGGQPPVAAALHLDMNTGTISCTVGAATSSWQLPVGALQVKVLTKPSQDGRMLIGYEVGFQSHAAAMVDVDLHPATALHLVGRAAKVQRDGDVMILDFGSTKVRIDANGQLAEDHFTFVSEDMPMEASWLQAGFGAPPRAATMDDPRALLALGNMLLTDALPADVLRDGADRRVPARAHAGRREPPDRRQDRTRAPAAGPEQRHASDALHGPWRDPRETGRESAVQRVARGPFRRFRLIIARQQYAFREASAHGAAPRRTRSTVDGDHVRGLAPARRRGAHGGVSATR